MTKAASVVVPYSRATATALILPRSLDKARWVEIGKFLSRVDGGVQWWIGDWWRHGEARVDYGTGEEKAAAAGLNYGTCRNNAYVAAAFELSRRRDNLSFKHHAEVASLSVEEQEQLLDRAEGIGGEKMLSTAAIRTEVRRGKAKNRIAEAAREAEPLAKLGRFQILYADPPWAYDDATPNRAVENHYPTMALDAITALEVPAADDALLFLWSPCVMLREALRVMSAWGFEYQTNLAWVKPQLGMGYWFRSKHELLLLGKRGEFPHPPSDARFESVLVSPRRQHSQKPDEIYDMIEKMYPGASCVELFARQSRAGWKRWGNEAVV